jgi:hypothetical protein
MDDQGHNIRLEEPDIQISHKLNKLQIDLNK